MGTLMDLVAGDAREILLAIGLDDFDGLRNRSRFVAHISFGGGMDPTWLDLFTQAAREATNDVVPAPFAEACCPLDGPGDVGDRTIEKVDRHWVDDVAQLPDMSLDAIAARWIDLIDCEECTVDSEEKPMLRELAHDLVEFCRRAVDAEDVLFAWSI